MTMTSWADMNHYQRADARMLVEGYRITKQPTETAEQWFERAKRECLTALDKRRAQVACMTFEQMFPRAGPTAAPPPDAENNSQGNSVVFQDAG